MSRSLKTLTSLRTPLQRLSILGFALAGLIVLGGCASGSKVASTIDTEQVDPLDEVAVVSVRTKKIYKNELGETSLENTESVRKAVSTIPEVTERRRRRADPNYKAGANRIRDYLFGEFRSIAPFSMVEEDALLQSSAYQTVELNPAKNWQTSLFATPKGYRSLDPDDLTDKASAKALIEALPTTPDGLLFAEATYTLVPKSVRRVEDAMWTSNISDGTHAQTTPTINDTVWVDVKATVHLRVYDRSGNKSMRVTQTARSNKGFPFVYGEGWSARQIDAAVQAATQQVVENITTHLQNKLPADVLAKRSSVLPKSESKRVQCTCSQ